MRALPVSPIWAGLGVGAGVFALYLASGLALDAWRPTAPPGTPPWRIPDVREVLLLSVLLGGALAAEPLARRNAIRLLETLRPSIRGGDQEAEGWQRRMLERHATPRRACMLLGAVGGVWVSIATDPEPFAISGPRAHEDLWQAGVNLFVCLFFSRAIYATLFIARRCTLLARDGIEVDLLDLEPLREFTRFGLRTATLWVVGGSVVALFFLNWGFSIYTAIGVAGTLGIASAIVLRPVRAVQQRIRAEKRAALDQLNRALRRDRALVLDGAGSGAGEAAARLPGLLAYRDFLTAVPEWPFDLSTSLRSALLLAVAVGSWLGGAVVERLLGAALD
ncbi:MAG: hypothetical protein QNK03_06555 [Myxococcota bacterium]|nr:hypothetical protein [Myxococcota bacterium]